MTAAVWFLFVHLATPREPSTTSPNLPSQMFTTLSFPPLASSSPSALHLSPHTSPTWPTSSMTLCRAIRTSWCQMLPSPHPELRTWPFQLRVATWFWCPPIVRSFCPASMSQRSTSPVPFPTPRKVPSFEKSTEET